MQCLNFCAGCGTEFDNSQGELFCNDCLNSGDLAEQKKLINGYFMEYHKLTKKYGGDINPIQLNTHESYLNELEMLRKKYGHLIKGRRD